MKKNVWAIIGVMLIIIFAIAGHFMDFDQAWIVQVAGAAVGLGIIITDQAKKHDKRERWKTYLVGGGVALGAMLAVIGGVNESIITTIIGAVLVIAGAAVGIVTGAKSGRAAPR